MQLVDVRDLFGDSFTVDEDEEDPRVREEREALAEAERELDANERQRQLETTVISAAIARGNEDDEDAPAVAAVIAAGGVASTTKKAPRKRKKPTPTVATGAASIASMLISGGAVPIASSSTTVAAAVRLLPPVKQVRELTLGNQLSDDGILLRAVYGCADQLGHVLSHLHIKLQFASIRFDARGMLICGVDKQVAMFINVTVPRDSFLLYDMGEGSAAVVQRCVRSSAFHGIAQEFVRSYSLTLYTVTNGFDHNSIGVQLHPALMGMERAVESLHVFPNNDVNTADAEIDPRGLYQFRVLMRARDIVGLVRRLNTYSLLTFTLTDRGLDILAYEGERHTSSRYNIGYTRPPTQSGTIDWNPLRMCGSSGAGDDSNAAALLALPQSERDAFAELEADGKSVMLCKLDRIDAQMPLAQMANMRYPRRLVFDGLMMAPLLGDYIEWFFCRLDHVGFGPMLIRHRALDERRERVLISENVFISPKLETSS